MVAMTQPKRKPGRPRSAAPKHSFSISLPQDVNDALDRFCDQSDPKIGKLAAIESAIRAFLQARGIEVK